MCSFFGHRTIKVNEELKQKIREIVKDLIERENVKIFLFGSRREFDNLCHSIVTQLMEIYPNIKRVSYTCCSETCIIENEREKNQEIFSRLSNREIHFQGFEEEVKHKTTYLAGRASYIERNKAMINDSDYWIFYYDENHKTDLKKISKCCFGCYQSNSGTAIAYKYAKQKKKICLTLLEFI